jgi:hypothetical protein
MLLFHGTTEQALEGILKRGLVPRQSHATEHDWVWELSGRSQGSAVFLSTAPVAGRGGDPVSFAMGWPVKHTQGSAGYIVVVDLPMSDLNLVHGVVPNIELNSFISVFRTRSFLRQTVYVQAYSEGGDRQQPLARWNLSHFCSHYWLARYCADHRVALTPSALKALITLEVGGIDPALPPDLTPLRWQTFLDDYFRLVYFSWRDISSPVERERRRQTILRHHGITLPEEFEEDDHRKHCRLCIGGLVHFFHRFDGFNDYRPFRDFLTAQPKKSGFQRLPETARLGSYMVGAPLPDGGLGAVQSLVLRLRAVRAHTMPFSDEAVLTFFRTEEASDRSTPEPSWSWGQWYEAFPADRCAIPRLWRPGYGQRFDAADLKLPDRQVMAEAIPTKYVLGAIKIYGGHRLVKDVRPGRRKGETLSSKLWTLVHTLRSQYAGIPIVLD